MDDSEIRVKYYPPSDFAHGFFNIQKIELLYQNPDISIGDINTALEYYNIYLYFADKSSIVWKKWSSKQISYFTSFATLLKQKAYKYFSTIEDLTFCDFVHELDYEYTSDFLELLLQTKVYKRISQPQFEKALNTKPGFIYPTLRNEGITNFFGTAIRDFLLSFEDAGEILITAANSEGNSTVSQTYLPKCLQDSEKYSILEKYVDSDSADPNHISLLMDLPIRKKLPRPLVRKYLHKKKELEDKVLSENSIKMTITILFTEGQYETKIECSQNQLYRVSYSYDWIVNNLDYPTLLNNLIYMFDLSGGDMLLKIPQKAIIPGLFELIFESNKHPKLYNMGHQANFLETIAHHSFMGYCRLLQTKNVFFEKIFPWFFSEYIPTEFHIPAFSTHMPDPLSSNLEKCMAIVLNFDSICRQFNCYYECRQLDYELLSISSLPLRIEGIPSLVKNKYAYGKGDNYHNLSFILFNNQCRLNDQTKKCANFYELLKNSEVYLSDYPSRPYINSYWQLLKSYQIIKINENGKIEFDNYPRAVLLHTVFINDCVNYHRLPPEMKTETDILFSMGDMEFEDTLLTKAEADYFNYYLNDAFSNGLELRNLYAHGIEFSNGNDAKHFNNYMILLRLMCCLIIKINDDMDLFDINNRKTPADVSDKKIIAT